jgi:hypothetical protein
VIFTGNPFVCLQENFPALLNVRRIAKAIFARDFLRREDARIVELHVVLYFNLGIKELSSPSRIFLFFLPQRQIRSSLNQEPLCQHQKQYRPATQSTLSIPPASHYRVLQRWRSERINMDQEKWITPCHEARQDHKTSEEAAHQPSS